MSSSNSAKPTSIEELLHHASVAVNTNNLVEAQRLTDQILRVQPKNADALNIYAYVQMQINDPKAEETILKAIAINGKNCLFHITHGLILRLQGKYDQAIEANKKALKLSTPDYVAQIYANMGDCYQNKHDLPTAHQYFEKSIAADPHYARAYLYWGILNFELGGDPQQTEIHLKKALALDPNNAVAFHRIGTLLFQQSDYISAIRLLMRAVDLNPNYEEAWELLGHAYDTIGNVTGAQTLYEQLIKQFPNNSTVKLRHAFLLPHIPMSNEDIDAWRAKLLGNIDHLIETKFVLDDPIRHTFGIPFYQGYHGRDNTVFMKKMAEFFLKCCPSVHFTAPHCLKPLKPKARIRVGFVAGSFESALLTQFYGKIVEALANDPGFEVVLFSAASTAQSLERMTAMSQKYVLLPKNLSQSQQLIAQEEIDILIYLEVGMHLLNYLLPFARLAPIQAVMAGHPITSGIPNMDYFFSSKELEIPGAQAHYSEKLMLLPTNPVIFKRTPPLTTTKLRKDLGLPEEVHLYTCPVTLHKVHPDMDKVFMEILTRDPKSHILLFDSKIKILWGAHLRKRFDATMPPELSQRIHFIAFTPGEDFFHILRAVDSILDPFHFSFGTTALQLLGADIPFVTLPGEFMRGRGAFAMYNEMGVTDLIANSPEHYVELALKLANDKTFREEMAAKIAKTSDRLFNKTEVGEMYKTCLKELYQAKVS